MPKFIHLISERQMGFLIVFSASFGYSCLPIFTRLIYNVSSLQATDVALWRYIFGVPLIWMIIALRQRTTTYAISTSPTPLNHVSNRKLPPHRNLWILGALYAGAALSAFVGLEYINASLYVVLFFTYPTMVALLSVFFGVRLSRRAWGAVGLTLIGVFLTIPDWNALQGADLLGVLIALLNALFVAVYFLASGYFMRGITSMARGTAWIMTYTFICLGLLLPFFGLGIPQDLTTWGLLFGLATFSTAMPIFMLNIGIQMIGAPQTAIISSIEPVITMILALALLDEVIVPLQWLGVVAIIIAVVLLELRLPRRHMIPKNVT